MENKMEKERKIQRLLELLDKLNISLDNAIAILESEFEKRKLMSEAFDWPDKERYQ